MVTSKEEMWRSAGRYLKRTDAYHERRRDRCGDNFEIMYILAKGRTQSVLKQINKTSLSIKRRVKILQNKIRPGLDMVKKPYKAGRARRIPVQCSRLMNVVQ